MKTTQEEKLEKFGPGPWIDEPDHVEFRHEGFPCIIHRNHGGVWCGYVAVPPGHPWHGKEYYGVCEGGVHADVHGGLTYAEECQGEICHVPAPGEPDNVWWVGFDCGHSYDLCPYMHKQFPVAYRGTYRDQDYVTGEVKSLAVQAKAAQ